MQGPEGTKGPSGPCDLHPRAGWLREALPQRPGASIALPGHGEGGHCRGPSLCVGTGSSFPALTSDTRLTRFRLSASFCGASGNKLLPAFSSGRCVWSRMTAQPCHVPGNGAQHLGEGSPPHPTPIKEAQRFFP